MSLQVAYGHPPGPTPPADYAPSLRSPWRAAFVDDLFNMDTAAVPLHGVSTPRSSIHHSMLTRSSISYDAKVSSRPPRS